MSKHTIFSAMQPTGALHLGNYLGALKNWVNLQNSGDYSCIFGIVDLHAMTIDYDPKKMPDYITDLVIDYLSCGIDPEKSLILVQSHVPEHAELAWILNCLTPMAELERMTQFKDKSKEHKQNINVGLFAYPVLQAADILLYKADTVPVGEDQIQHVEFSRLIARKFNNKFGQTFPEPKTLLTKSSRLMSLADPSKKMSKSLGEKHYIALTDSPAEIKEKIKTAVTDYGQKGCIMKTYKHYTLPSKCKINGGENLLNLFEQFSEDKKLLKKFKDDYENGKLKYSELKPILADSIIKYLKPIQAKRKELEHNREKIGEILIESANQAQKIATKTMQEVREKVGIR